jgi:hypothetical protein
LTGWDDKKAQGTAPFLLHAGWFMQDITARCSIVIRSLYI